MHRDKKQVINGNSETSGFDFLKRLRLRWPLALGVFGTLFVCVAVVVLSMPNKYESRLKIVVKNDRIDPFVGSDKQTQSILNVNDVSEPRINTEIQLLTSSKVLLEVVKTCHLDNLVGMRGQPQSTREQAALRQLQRELVVTPIRNSNVIEVSYESIDAKRSAEVVSALWQSYNFADRKMHGVPGSLDFFERLSSEYDTQLAQAQLSLTQFRTQHNIVSLPEELSLALANAAHLRSQIADSSAEQQRSAASAARLKQEMESLPISLERDRRSMPNQALTQQLTSLLVTLQNKRTESSLRYQPGDRLLKELDSEIARTQSALEQAGRSPADEVTVAANPAMDLARSEYLRVTAVGAGAQAQTSELARQLNKDRANLAALTADSWTYKQLVQKVVELEELDLSYHKKVEEARFEQLLDQQQISNLAVVDEPFTSALPSSPRRGLLLSLGFIWSVLIALVTAAIVEALADRDDRRESTSSPVAPPSGIRLPPQKVTAAARSPLSVSPSASAIPLRNVTHRSPSRAVSSFTSHRDPLVPEERPATSQELPLPVESEGLSNIDTFSQPMTDTLAMPTPVQSSIEFNETAGLPLLASFPAISLSPTFTDFSALYLSVQRTQTSRRSGGR